MSYPNPFLRGAAALLHDGFIRVKGDDAALFLHGQLTCDFVLHAAEKARLAGFYTAKDRLQASFVGFKRSPNDILRVCPRDMLAAVLKRLSMIVMHAKVQLSDASSDVAMSADDEVFARGGDGQYCCIVAEAATAAGGGFGAIVATQIGAFETDPVHLGEATGPLMQLSAPPEPLLADI